MKKTYRFKTKLAIWNTEAGAWHFLTLPKKESAEIKEMGRGARRRGFGSLRVSATIGKSTWKTSIFPSKDGTYLLPVKAKVRDAEGIAHGDTVSYSISFI